MYVLKNAWKNVVRAKGRSILSFVLVFVIAVSACVALSIQNSAERAKQSAYDSMTVTASISTNRTSMMGQMSGDPTEMLEEMMSLSQGLDMDTLEIYAEADSVYAFFYTASVSLDSYEDVLISYSLTDDDSSSSQIGMGMMDMGMGMGMEQTMVTVTGDFTITGYSSHDAMDEFIDGTLVISDGAMFDTDDETNSCVISEEIALLNDLSVGDSFTLVNPSKDDELVELTIAGIFSCETTDSYANDIYISAYSIVLITENSAEVAETYTDDDLGVEMSTALVSMPSAVYVFESPDDYEDFEDQAVALGLDTDTYSITSTDLAEFEESIVPLENLSTFTMIFFVVVLAIGALILVVFNLFTIRERKYEIGVLAAIGMQKPKVAMQFIAEVVIVTFIAILVGAGIGAIISNPLGDTLLESQLESVESQSQDIDRNFGGNFGGEMMGGSMSTPEMSGSSGFFGGAVDYIDTLNTSTNLVVLIQLMGLGLGLSVVASSVGIISILRYEPLKILSERA